jgi:hypothetical protein
MECMRNSRRSPNPARALRAGIAAAVLAFATSPWDAGAQAQAEQRAVARLKAVSGNVLVSRESGLAAGAQAERLVNGTRIITTANSEAVIEFDNGCEVRLKENERFDVDSTRACALMVAQPLGVPVGAIPLPLAVFAYPGSVAGMILTTDDIQANPVSPN